MTVLMINSELIWLWGKLYLIYTFLSDCIYFCHTILFSVNYSFIKTTLKGQGWQLMEEHGV